MELRPALRCLATALALLALPASAYASATQESMFQDDDKLEFSPAASVDETLDTLRALGVDRIRVSVFWKAVAPSPARQDKPAGFDASNPDAYPHGAWDRYDRLVIGARARGLAVAFDVTGPAPMWATGNPARSDIDETYTPSADEYAAFVRAVGTRYSGQFVPHPAQTAPPPSEQCPVPNIPPLPPGCATQPPPPPAPPPTDALPRVDYWEIWNEPNQAGWLTPQWLPNGKNKAQIPVSPTTYRALADAMYTALQGTGHGADTILVGATAPKGLNVKGITRSIKPLRFIRELYCVDSNLQAFKGEAAKARGCPETNQVASFGAAHPVLFGMTGWAHHPYELTFAPNRPPTDRDFVTIANLGRLSDTMRRVYARYAKPQPKGGVPLYLTEFGYQTNPPDRLGVTPARQAAYLDQAEYLSWRYATVRTISQFLLVDGGDPVGLDVPERPEVDRRQAQAVLPRLPAADLAAGSPCRARHAPARVGAGPHGAQRDGADGAGAVPPTRLEGVADALHPPRLQGPRLCRRAGSAARGGSHPPRDGEHDQPQREGDGQAATSMSSAGSEPGPRSSQTLRSSDSYSSVTASQS